MKTDGMMMVLIYAGFGEKYVISLTLTFGLMVKQNSFILMKRNSTEELFGEK